MVKPLVLKDAGGYSDRHITLAPPSTVGNRGCDCRRCPIGCAGRADDMRAWQSDIARYGGDLLDGLPRVPLDIRCRCLECSGLMMHVCIRAIPGYGRTALARAAVTPCSEPMAPTADTRISVCEALARRPDDAPFISPDA